MRRPGGEDYVGEVEHCWEDAAGDSLLPKWDQEKLIKMYGTSNSFSVKPQAYRLRLQQGHGLLGHLRFCHVYMEPDISSKVRLTSVSTIPV